MRQRIALVFLLLLAGACAHTKQKKPTEQPQQTVQPPNIPGQPPLSVFPAEMFAPGGVKKMQEALSQKGFQVAADGVFGPATQTQLQAFQKQQHLPETGMPDQDTIRKLGLNPEEIFKSKPPPQKGS